jgi:hypothetical protein
MAREQSSEELIRTLVRDTTPVRPVPALRTSLAASLLTWTATAVAFSALAGAWPHAFTLVTTRGESALVLLGLAGAGAGALLYALAAAVPGRERAARVGGGISASGLAILLVVPLVGHFASALELQPAYSLRRDLVCMAGASLVGLPTAIVAGYLCLRAAALRRHATLWTVGLGGAALGAVLIQVLCGEGSLRHTLGSHVLAPGLLVPVLAASALRRS